MKSSLLVCTFVSMTLLIPIAPAFCASPSARTQHPSIPNLTDTQKDQLRTQLVTLLKKHPKADVLIGDVHCESAGFDFFYDPKTQNALGDLNFAAGYVEVHPDGQENIDVISKLAAYKGTLPADLEEKLRQQMQKFDSVILNVKKTGVTGNDCGANGLTIIKDRETSFLSAVKGSKSAGLESIVAGNINMAEGIVLDEKFKQLRDQHKKGLVLQMSWKLLIVKWFCRAWMNVPLRKQFLKIRQP